METVKNIVIALHLAVCLALIVVTMMQSKDDDGLSGTITGSSSDNFLDKNKGRTKEGKLKRLTMILSVAFVVLTIAVSIIYVV